MARNFVDKYAWVTGARQEVEEYFWDHIVTSDGAEHGHSFQRHPEVRTTVVIKDGDAETVISGLQNLVGAEQRGQRVPRASRRSSTPRWSRPRTGSWPPRSPPGGATTPDTDVDWDKTYERSGR